MREWQEEETLITAEDGSRIRITGEGAEARVLYVSQSVRLYLNRYNVSDATHDELVARWADRFRVLIEGGVDSLTAQE